MPAPKIVKVTLPADGTWTEAIDVFGYTRLLAIPLDIVQTFTSAYVRTSPDGQLWFVPEGGTVAISPQPQYQTTSYYPLYDIAQDPAATLIAPYISFKAVDTNGYGKRFYLYCLQ